MTNWPVRQIFPVESNPSFIQPTAYVPTARSNLRRSIMHHAQQLDRPKTLLKAAAGSSTKIMKRKPPGIVAQASSSSEAEEPLMKRYRTTKPVSFDTHKNGGTVPKPQKNVMTTSSTGSLSAKTMSKLDGFRFSVHSDRRCSEEPSSATSGPVTDQAQDCQGTEANDLGSRHVTIHQSARVLQSSDGEMAGISAEPKLKVEQSKPIEPAGAGISACNSIEGQSKQVDLAKRVAGPAQHQIKDHPSKLILADINASGGAQSSAPISESPEDRPNLQSVVLIDTAGAIDVDDFDDSVLEQIIADEETDWQEPQSAIQVEISCCSNDSVSSSTKPCQVFPTQHPLPAASPGNTIDCGNQPKAVPTEASLIPFLRPAGAVLVTSTPIVPNVSPDARIVTCFRIAGMLRELSSPIQPFAVELYTTVSRSVRSRDGTHQLFIFADLFFPQRPPYVHGIYAKCAGSELFDDDSRPFLQAGQGGKGILARAIVRPKATSGKELAVDQSTDVLLGEETSFGTAVEVLSIYVCSWEDITYTKGIVMPEKEERETNDQPEKKPKFALPKLLEGKKALEDISANPSFITHDHGGKEKVIQIE